MCRVLALTSVSQDYKAVAELEVWQGNFTSGRASKAARCLPLVLVPAQSSSCCFSASQRQSPSSCRHREWTAACETKQPFCLVVPGKMLARLATRWNVVVQGLALTVLLTRGASTTITSQYPKLLYLTGHSGIASA